MSNLLRKIGAAKSFLAQVVAFVVVCACSPITPDLIVPEECVEVDIDDLYMRYKQFDNTFVCTSGKIDASPGGVYVIPNDLDLTRDGQMLVQLDVSYFDYINDGHSDAERLILSGLFTYDKACFGETDDAESKTICAPIQYKMDLSNTTISKTAR